MLLTFVHHRLKRSSAHVLKAYSTLLQSLLTICRVGHRVRLCMQHFGNHQLLDDYLPFLGYNLHRAIVGLFAFTRYVSKNGLFIALAIKIARFGPAFLRFHQISHPNFAWFHLLITYAPHHHHLPLYDLPFKLPTAK